MTLFNRMGRLARRRNPKRSVLVNFEQCEERFLLATVTTTADSGATSLRQVINAGNKAGVPFTIDFNIPIQGNNWNPATSTFTFALTGVALPAITAPVTIDGTTESTHLGQKAFLAIDGTGITVSPNGLDLAAASPVGSDISGLELLNWKGTGILVQSMNNTIGGTIAPTGKVIGSANVISSNAVAGVSITGAAATGNLIEGNFIGTDITGTAPNLGNPVDVVLGTASNTVGGTISGAAAANVIASSTTAGVQVLGSAATGNVVEGNYLGTNSANAVNLGNGAAIQVFGASTNLIGGTVSGAGNTIGFNTNSGVGVLSGNANAIRENTFIGTNGVLTQPTVAANDIGLGPGANNNQPAPSLISASLSGNQLSVLLSDSGPTVPTGTTVNVDLYLLNSGSKPLERTFLGPASVVTGATPSSVSIPVSGVIVGDSIIATATVAANGTSVFSSSVSIAQPFTVTNTYDSGAGTLRAAITFANGNPNTTISFVIPTSDPGFSAGTWTITLTSALPPITAKTTINGATNNVPAIAINGSKISTPADGLSLTSISGSTSDGSKVLGLDIYGFASGAGIHIQSNGDLIASDYLGTNVTATAAGPGNLEGVLIDGTAGSNTIGGTTAAAANVIGSNTAAGVSIGGTPTSGNLVAGNFIGTNASGANLGDVVGVAVASSGNTIGGTATGFGNIIGFNTATGGAGAGVSISGVTSTGDLVAGNYIGTNATGNHMANDAGVAINGPSSNTVGGNVSGAGNTIAFNNGAGVNVITGTGNPILRNLIYTNGEGIVLTSGGNNGQTLPKITGVTSVATGVNTTSTTITVDLTATGFSGTSTYSLDFFASAPGDPVTGVQAHIYLGTQTFTGGTTGSATFTSLTTPLSTSQTVTATATLLAGSNFTDTSTFAAPVSVPVPFLVTTTGATGPGSLQQAILDADADKTNPNADLIKFAIATGSAPYVITPPLTGLQPITRPVILDATSQPGYSGVPIIVLNGNGLTSGSGLVLSPGSDGSTIEGFDIVNFTTSGADGIDVESGKNVVQANYVGVGVSGVTGGPNAQGVLINGSNNTIGGTAVGAANVIALNTGDNVNVNSGNGNAIRENSIYLSGTPPLPPSPPPFSGQGIVLGTNANDGQAAPTNLSVNSVPNLTIIQGSITGKVAGSYTVDFFASNPADTFGPAFQFLGSTIVGLTTAGTPQAFKGSLNIPVLTPGQSVTATVTSPAAATSPHANNTSPFAASVVFVATSNFVVTNTDDSGNGSLRQAIMNADQSPGQQTITFNLGSLPATIDLDSALPEITNEVFLIGPTQKVSGIAVPLVQINGQNLPVSGFLLGAHSDGSIIEGLDIRNFGSEGIDIQSSFNDITDDVIGLNTSAGVLISGASITANVLSGNFIGADTSGKPLANGTGVIINNSAANNTIGGAGAANTIAFNNVGVQVDGAGSPPSTGNVISQNLIFSNVANYSPSAIVLSNGGNEGQAAPDGLAFTSVKDLTTIDGQIVNPMVGGSYTVEFFASSSAGNPASQYLGSLVVVIPSQAPMGGTLGGFTASFSNIDFNNLAGQSVTATVTGPGGNTSPFATPVTQSPQFEVTNTTDNVPGKEVDSLRIAILNANFADLSSNTIAFKIPGGGSFVIAPTTALPAIIVPAVTVDGTQQSGYAGLPLVQISGASISGAADGLTLGALSIGSKIEGLDIANFTGGAGIHIESNNDSITGNFLGTDLTGKVAGPGNQVGVLIDDSSGNTIGGTVSGAGNTIGFSSIAGIEMINSGATGNVVVGNFIGTDSAGDILPNTVGVLDNTTGNTIGALNVLNKDGSIQVLNGNLIGFNTTAGIQITGTGTAGDVVTGNLIGTDSAGDPRANGVGVIVGTGNNVIGGIVSGSANVIDFNSSAGIQITGPSDPTGTGNVVEGNDIGTNPSNPSLNQGDGVGVQIASAFNNTIGGTTAGTANFIGFNSAEGIQITGTGALDNLVEGNFIGTDTAGTVNQGNGVGVQIVNASDNTIGGTGQGQGNTIGFNTQNGILVRSADGSGNSIRENTYNGTNGPGTPTEANDIALSQNLLNTQPAPTLVAASIPSSSSTILSLGISVSEPGPQLVEVYLVEPGNPGQRIFLGPMELSVSGNVQQDFQITVAAGLIVPSSNGKNGSVLVATATDMTTGTTSVFSARIQVFDSLTVTTTKDGQDSSGNAFVGSLRYAIDYADFNAPPPAKNPTDNTFHITFAILTVPPVISLNSALPTIVKPVTIDGTTESTFLIAQGGQPAIVEINGMNVPAEIKGVKVPADGFTLAAGSDRSTITGLDIAAFTSGAGIHIQSSNDVITDNFLGTDPTGKVAGPGNEVGILIDDNSATPIGGSGNTIGGTSTTLANVIGFNTTGVSISGTLSTGNLVEGNYIGTDSAGDPLANGVGVLDDTTGNAIGGTLSGAANIIGFNTTAGIQITGTGTAGDVVSGNFIGTDAAGDRLGNVGVGVSVDSGSNTIGGTTSSGGNTIGFNTMAGVSILGSGNIVAGNFIGTDSLGSSGSGGTNMGNGLGVFVGGANNRIGALNAVNSDGTINISNGLNGNLIAFNTNAGVSISGTSATGNVIEGNLIGTDTFLNLLGNRVGVVVSAGASGNMIGGAPNKSPITIRETISSLGTNANYIVGNTTAGVSISGAAASSPNTIEGNLISRNALNGIDLEGDLTGTAALAQIEFNFIGTDPTGTKTYDSNNHPLGNGLSGILLDETTDGTSAGPNDAVTVLGNVVSGNGLSGITVQTFDTTNAPLAKVEISSNIIGLDVTGSQAVASGSLPLGNVLDGVLINNVVDVTVGDPSAGMVPTTPSNVISGNLGRGIEVRGQLLNSFGFGTNTIEGNYIGTDATGRKAVSSSANINYSLGNLADGIFLFVPPNTQIENNLISNNRSAGIHAATQSSGGAVAPSGTITIQTNLIGTDVTGEQDTDLTNRTVSLGNGSDGVFLDSITSGTTIGGTSSGAGNVISGNRANGINLLDSSNVVILENEIGTDISGSSANLGNDSNGIFINGSSDVTVGGTDGATDRNIISGNLATGILISGASFTEFPVPTLKSSPLGITLGTDGNFWFTESAADKIGMIDPTTGTITEFPIPTANSDPTGITLGSDGNLWFTETKADKIGEINPMTHNITEFPLPTADSDPTGITSGPSVTIASTVIPGNLWFTETNANQIGEINPTTHQITEFPIPTANSDPTGITAGPDGNLWFTESNSSKIGILVYSPLTNTATITDFATLTPNSGPTGITAGPNGNLWFTETSANKIGEIATTGAIVNEFTVPTANSGPTGISLGSDGSLWFTETSASQIAGINPTTGAFKEFAIPTMNSGPSGMVSSPTGSLWFTEASGNRIARFANTFPTSHNVIQGNDIGLNALGTVAIPNNDSGVVISQGDNNMIGGAATGAGNLISGNLLYGVLISGGGSNNAIEGNDIGTGASGLGASGLGNTSDGVFLLGGNPMDQNETVTQNTVSQNVISGNGSNGIQIFGQGSTENTVSNNLIGIGTDATPAPNLGNGVFLNDAGPNNVIGTGNVIAGNNQSGVMIVSDNLNFGNDSDVAGNYIGTDANGTRNIGNGANGIFIYGSSGNTIGGTGPGAGNVISGNNQSGVVILTPALSALADNNQLIGNQIGTNSGGTAPLPNQSDGVEIINSVANTIGPNNVVSGNLGNGVLIESLSNSGSGSPTASKNLVFGNQIGTYATAANLLFNGQNGVLVSNSSSNTIGGVSSDTVFAANVPTAPSNVISGNVLAGIQFFGTSQNNVVQGNYIGVDADGSTVPGTAQSQAYGVYINDLGGSTGQESIGGTGAGQGNLISGNGTGIQITGPQNSAGGLNSIQGNVIGLDKLDDTRAGNSIGVYILNSASNTIGGTSTNVFPGTTVPVTPNNVISGNAQGGILITGSISTNNLVAGNDIGTNLDGTGFPSGSTESAPGQFSGVLINNASSNNIIGGAAAGNVISGNDIGVQVVGLKTANGNIVGGQELIMENLIGTDATGTRAVSNLEFGILINNSASNTIGPGNLLSANGVGGVELLNAGSVRNRVIGNRIGTDINSKLAFQSTSFGTATTSDGITVYRNAQLNGVVVLGASSNTIGATTSTPGQGNYIAGNIQVGVYITSRDFHNQVYPQPVGNWITGNTFNHNPIYGILFYDATNNLAPRFVGRGGGLVNNSFIKTRTPFRNYVNSFDIKTKLVPSQAKKSHPSAHKTKRHPTKPRSLVEKQVRLRVPALFEAGSRHVVVHVNKAKARKHGG
jgi:streptogramin lyase